MGRSEMQPMPASSSFQLPFSGLGWGQYPELPTSEFLTIPLPSAHTGQARSCFYRLCKAKFLEATKWGPPGGGEHAFFSVLGNSGGGMLDEGRGEKGRQNAHYTQACQFPFFISLSTFGTELLINRKSLPEAMRWTHKDWTRGMEFQIVLCCPVS